MNNTKPARGKSDGKGAIHHADGKGAGHVTDARSAGLHAPRGSKRIYSTPQVAASGKRARSAAHARVAASLAEHEEYLLSSWMEALRAHCGLYKSVSDDDLAASLAPIFRAYRVYFAEDDAGPFLDAVASSARRRFAEGFPLVAVEENVGAVRSSLLPVIFQAFAAEPERLADVVESMMSIEEMAFVQIAETYQDHAAADLHAAREDVLRAEREKVAFCRDMARMATKEKLHLRDMQDLPPRTDTQTVEITDARDVRTARHAAAAVARGAAWPEAAAYSLQLCVGEAGANALHHAGHATFQTWLEGGDIIIRIADSGPGIDLDRIPHALRSGFSTGSTLGMGFPLMLDAAHRIDLATEPGGTILQLTLRPE